MYAVVLYFNGEVVQQFNFERRMDAECFLDHLEFLGFTLEMRVVKTHVLVSVEELKKKEES